MFTKSCLLCLAGLLYIPPRMKILVVEDEKKVRNFITQVLEDAGMTSDTASSAEEMLVAAKTASYDVIILDRLLGSADSLDLMPDLRKLNPRAKIIVLSALSEVDEKVRGLSGGADDYLGKPFHVSELIARVRALARRAVTADRAQKDTLIIYGDLRIDLETQRVHRGGRRIDLTAKEFKTLCLMARSPGQIFSKTKILDEAWDLNHYPESNVVEVTIANLRSKLDRGMQPLIHSRRGVGYWLGEK